MNLSVVYKNVITIYTCILATIGKLMNMHTSHIAWMRICCHVWNSRWLSRNDEIFSVKHGLCTFFICRVSWCRYFINIDHALFMLDTNYPKKREICLKAFKWVSFACQFLSLFFEFEMCNPDVCFVSYSFSQQTYQFPKLYRFQIFDVFFYRSFFWCYEQK